MYYNSLIKERCVLLKKEANMKTVNEELLEKIRNYVKTYQIKNGDSPSYRNIASHFSIASLSQVSRYIDLLVSRGDLEKDEDGRINCLPSFNASAITIAPVVGVVTCGQPIFAQENIEGVYALPSDIFGSGEIFLLRAEGDSMIEAGIHSGDLLVIRRAQTAENGQIVVALLDDSATVKTFYKKIDHVVLHPENRNYDDIISTNVSILGVVEHCIHKF